MAPRRWHSHNPSARPLRQASHLNMHLTLKDESKIRLFLQKMNKLKNKNEINDLAQPHTKARQPNQFSSQNDPRENPHTFAQTQFTWICRTLMKRYVWKRKKLNAAYIWQISSWKDIISLCESYHHQYHHHHNHNHNHQQQHSMPCSIKYLYVL